MTSCENRQFLPPPSPPSLLLRPHPSEQKMTPSWSAPPPPSNFFYYFIHFIIFISLWALVSAIINAMDHYIVNLLYHTKWKKTCFSRLAGGVQTIYLYLRRSYIIAVARVFYLNKLKKLGRIGECMLLFQKVKKTHEQILRLKHIDV